MKPKSVLCIHAALAFACALVCVVRAQAPNPGPVGTTGQGPAAVPNPLDLRGAIRYAVDHNYAILQAREQIRQQEGVIIQVESAEIPNVSANAAYQRNTGRYRKSIRPRPRYGRFSSRPLRICLPEGESIRPSKAQSSGETPRSTTCRARSTPHCSTFARVITTCCSPVKKCRCKRRT
jgi:hypothetical protein